MKKVKNLILALLIICSPVLLTAMKSGNPQKKQFIFAEKKKPIYEFYSAYYQLTIGYNPANGRITGFAYDASTGLEVADFDHTGAGLTYDHPSGTVTLTNFQINIQGQGWVSIGGDFIRN